MSSGETDAPIAVGSDVRAATATHSGSQVTGCINRVQAPHRPQHIAVLSDPSIEKVMLSIDSVRKLVRNHDETARTYFRPDQTVITTTTTDDAILKALDWETELDLIRRFGPDYHIPTEYSVYASMTPKQQAQAIDDCMAGTEWMAHRLSNHDTTVLVQAKGWQPWHLARCKPTLERLNTRFVVFYATCYGHRIWELVADIRTVVTELSPRGIMVIGAQSPRFLSRAPPEVVAAAGCRWLHQSGYVDDGHRIEKHEQFRDRVETNLGSGQAMLNTYPTHGGA